MAESIAGYIITYGYFAIFGIVLLQELGMPGLPNELVLLYFGYLSHKTGLSYPLLILLVVMADIAGSFILYLLFYHAGSFLTRIKPKWFRLPAKKMSLLGQKIVTGKGGRNIFIAKLTPFIRSYLPVVAGILQVQPVLYGRIILLTAIIWSGGWVTVGWLINF
jgi:membrane-associated protein